MHFALVPNPVRNRNPHRRIAMKTKLRLAWPLFKRSRFKGRAVCAAALVSFAAGCLVTARLMQVSQARAESNRVFELMVYHTLPGKEPALESIFRDVSKLQAKHDLNIVGFWVPNDDPEWANTFVYLLAAPNREVAKKNWDALHADSDFPQYRKLAAPLIEKVKDEYKVDEVYMRPTDYSAMK
jgi:hypothetical protein